MMRSAPLMASATSVVIRSIGTSPCDAARLDPALRPQRGKTLRVARVQAHRIAACAEVGGGGATTMSGAENRNRLYCHFSFRVRDVVEGVTEDRIMGSMGRLSTNSRWPRQH